MGIPRVLETPLTGTINDTLATGVRALLALPGCRGRRRGRGPHGGPGRWTRCCASNRTGSSAATWPPPHGCR
ncbi:hypothetical protein [Nonomuraea sp. CA-141351]|uniref:hypothetical protein n=1 Tax=Nonomuraea sp. CA-141351 TaxID=3239996 RepID=UPI003D8DF703